MTHNNTPSVLKRITTVYVDKEDRFGLIGVAESGKHHRFWLTQRLLTQLVETLLLWLPQNPDEIQQIAQQVVQAEREPEIAVVASPDCYNWLVQEINLNSAAGVVSLQFKSDGDQYAVIVRFNEVSLRQWLGIVFSQYQLAGWLGVTWPHWLSTKVELALPEGVSVH
jgi:hypothetical protein